MARLSERVAKTKLLKGARVHDLRRTVTTWLREERLVSSDVCDQILHHARKGVNANHYTSARLKVRCGPRYRRGQTRSIGRWPRRHWQQRDPAIGMTPTTRSPLLDKIRDAYADAGRTRRVSTATQLGRATAGNA
jgi:hypothetical protein